jgi:hypothetical protein
MCAANGDIGDYQPDHRCYDSRYESQFECVPGCAQNDLIVQHARFAKGNLWIRLAQPEMACDVIKAIESIDQHHRLHP